MPTKTKAKPQAKAAPAPKANGKAAKTQAKAPEAKRENRYLRAARIIIEAGEGLDLAELAVKAEMSESTAGHCREAFVGVTRRYGRPSCCRNASPPAKPLPCPQRPTRRPNRPRRDKQAEP